MAIFGKDQRLDEHVPPHDGEEPVILFMDEEPRPDLLMEATLEQRLEARPGLSWMKLLLEPHKSTISRLTPLPPDPAPPTMCIMLLVSL